MFETIYQFAINTPWWVYLILAYLIFIGIRAGRPGFISLKRAVIIPVAFTALSIYTLLSVVQPSILHITIWLIAMLVGSFIGWIQIKFSRLKIDRERRLIWTEGNWTLLIIFILIFAAKYYFDYQIAVTPQIAQHPVFVYSLLTSSALLTGWFIGRISGLFYRLFNDPSQDLSKYKK